MVFLKWSVSSCGGGRWWYVVFTSHKVAWRCHMTCAGAGSKGHYNHCHLIH